MLANQRLRSLCKYHLLVLSLDCSCPARMFQVLTFITPMLVMQVLGLSWKALKLLIWITRGRLDCTSNGLPYCQLLYGLCSIWIKQPSLVSQIVPKLCCVATVLCKPFVQLQDHQHGYEFQNIIIEIILSSLSNHYYYTWHKTITWYRTLKLYKALQPMSHKEGHLFYKPQQYIRVDVFSW